MKHTVYVLFASILLASCGGGDKTDNKKADELAKLKKQRTELDQKIMGLEKEVNKNTPAKATPVSVLTLENKSFQAYIDVQAQITGDENVLATPQMMGVVTRILVRPGQKVSKGQTLAVLDAAALDQQVKGLESQLSLARQLYDKQQKLWAQNIGTEVQLLQAKTQYESAQSQRAALLAQKGMYSIKSPISGTVDDVPIKEGDAVTPGASGIRVVSKDKLKATASLGENYIGKVKEGDPVILVFSDLNDSVRTKLSYVAQSVNPVSRAFSVEIRLNNDSRLRPNMSCKMKISNYENNSALIVPVSVIQKTAEGEMVYIADGNKAKAVIVQTGRNSNGMVEILGGLNAGDKVITAGFEDLDNGEAISIL